MLSNTKPKGFSKHITHFQVFELLQTCLPYLGFADMQREAAELMVHYLLKHRIECVEGEIRPLPGQKAEVQTTLERTRWRQHQVAAPYGFSLSLIGELDNIVAEVWPDQPLLEGRRRLALQLLASIYVIKWSGQEYVRVNKPITNPVRTVRARNRNLFKLNETTKARRLSKQK